MPDDVLTEPIEIRTLGEFVTQYHEVVAGREFIFRGQSQDWELRPTLFRKQILYENCEDWLDFEWKLMKQFKQKALPYLNNIPKNDLEWTALAQHYRLPTRLLDWTLSPLAALLFAVRDSISLDETTDTHSVVWAVPLDTIPLISYDVFATKQIVEIDDRKIIRDENPNLERLLSALLQRNHKDFALYSAPHFDNRIRAQKAIFTVHPLPTKKHKFSALNTLLATNYWARKFIIPLEARKNIRLELVAAGFDSSSMFPDLEGISLSIQESFDMI